MKLRGVRHGIWLALLLPGCGFQSYTLFGEDSGTDEPDTGVVEEEDDAGSELPPGCREDTSKLPSTLLCTGLYSDFDAKKIADPVHEFTPAAPLWSDGAEKHRWISLPAGTKIDNSKANDWVFPVGTKLWKEFRVAGKRVETRLFWKTEDNFWRKGTYAWNADESEATLNDGGDITLPNGELYHLPELTECDKCHKGQADRALGFSAVNLGLEGASGTTLEWLANEGWLTQKPPFVRLSIGADKAGLDDDGVPLAAKALAVLHTNCGISCHNSNPSREANLTDQNLRLDSTLLDGRAPDESWSTYATAVGKHTEGAQIGGGRTRITPGSPADSYVITLMQSRTPGLFASSSQMPPIATRLVDMQGLAIVTKWISRLPGAAMDAGTPDAGMDASMSEAGMPDGGMDAGVDTGVDAGPDADIDAGDAELPDAGQPDADAEIVDSGDPDAGDPEAAVPAPN